MLIMLLLFVTSWKLAAGLVPVQTAFYSSSTIGLPINCYGGTSSITTVFDGSPPFTVNVFCQFPTAYFSSNTFVVAGSQTLTSLAAGTYTIFVSDSQGGSSTVLRTLTEPAPLSAVVTSAPFPGGAATTNITVTPSGGTAPYTVASLNQSWTQSGVTFATFEYITPGDYSFRVADSRGCPAYVTTVSVSQPAEPPLSAVVTPGPAILCNGGTTNITVAPSGGTAPYSVLWSSGASQADIGDGAVATFTGVTAGPHFFNVTDANGFTWNSDVVSVSQPLEPLSLMGTAPAILCNGGTTNITITPSGGTAPYSVKSLKDASTQSGIAVGAVATFTGFTASKYGFRADDANGCTIGTTVYLSEQPAALVVNSTFTPLTLGINTTNVIVTAAGGTGTLAGTGTFTGVPAGNYSYTVVDANGCAAITTGTIPPAPKYAFSGFFHPIDNEPVINTVKAGSAVPVKFSLGVPAGLNIFVSGSPSYSLAPCIPNAPSDAVEELVTSSTGNNVLTYDSASGRYTYVWQTPRTLKAGTCVRLQLSFDDGSKKYALFQMK